MSCKLTFIILLSVTCFCALSQEAASIKENTANPIPLIVYAQLNDYAKAVAQEFEIKYNVPVKVVRMRGSGATLLRLQYEKKIPQGHVWLGGSAISHAQASLEGLTQPYKPKKISLLDPMYRDPLDNHAVTGLYSGILCFMVNVNYLSTHNVPLPTSWQDLIHPRYKGMIGMKDPMISGTALTVLATIIQLMGEEKGFEYLALLDQNIWRYTKRQKSRLYRGDIGITIAFIHETENQAKNKQLGIEIIVPSEGTGYEIGGISLIKNSSNMVLARKFIDFALEKKWQNIESKRSNRIPTHIEAVRPKKHENLKNSKLIDFNFSIAGQKRQYWLERWQNQRVSEW